VERSREKREGVPVWDQRVLQEGRAERREKREEGRKVSLGAGVVIGH
jgi:hypothetical protein